MQVMFLILQILGLVSAWATKAMSDGKITPIEVAELITAMLTALGMRNYLEVKFPEEMVSDIERR